MITKEELEQQIEINNQQIKVLHAKINQLEGINNFCAHLLTPKAEEKVKE